MPIRFKKIYAFALSSITAALLVACGGGSSGGSSSSGGAGGSPTVNAISGAVIDGYIEGAKVCLDLNANGACDAGEPSATTDSNGQYTLDAGSANTTGLNLIAEVPDTAKDSDDGGLTLAAAGKSAYTMATFANQPAAITPLTTLIVGKVATEGLTVAAAKASVLETLGLPAETDLHEDHIASGNALVEGATRLVAAQLQQAQRNFPLDTAPSDRLLMLWNAWTALQSSSGSIFMESTDTDPLNMPAVLSDVATGRLFAYKMPSVKGQEINATAMLFTPHGTAPQEGWPLVVFGHGTVGVAQHCAPSVTMKASGAWGYAGLVSLMVQLGYVVVAPDYEGLGSADMGVRPGHPYLNLGSAGRSMALAAVAAKKLMGTELSGVWVTVGHSQGGHAALAGAQFASLAQMQEPSLSLKAVLAIAPASNLQASLNTMWSKIQNGSSSLSAYEALLTSNLYAAYLVQGTQSTPSPVKADQIFGARMRAIYSEKVGSECASELNTSIGNDITQFAVTTGAGPAAYPGVINAAVNTPAISRLLGSNEPGQVKLPGLIAVIQGEADTTVLPSSSEALIRTMVLQGKNAGDYHLVRGTEATHSGVLVMPEALNLVRGFLNEVINPS